MNFFRPRFRFPPVFRQHGGGVTFPFKRPGLFPTGTLFDDCSSLSGEENLSRGPFAQLSWPGCWLSVRSSSSWLLLFVGSRLLVVGGCWLLVFGSWWLLVVGFW